MAKYKDNNTVAGLPPLYLMHFRTDNTLITIVMIGPTKLSAKKIISQGLKSSPTNAAANMKSKIKAAIGIFFKLMPRRC
ncbi:hypothetical protein J6X15_02350 [Candidatus Saccharibacteria bacterium]|nr:hypothetical protein [Candidatus Saccharibacteria bacterium]MBP5656402.1 hypothetical protein [Candidatus Saccharibacteria bacterium]